MVLEHDMLVGANRTTNANGYGVRTATIRIADLDTVPGNGDNPRSQTSEPVGSGHPASRGQTHRGGSVTNGLVLVVSGSGSEWKEKKEKQKTMHRIRAYWE